MTLLKKDHHFAQCRAENFGQVASRNVGACHQESDDKAQTYKIIHDNFHSMRYIIDMVVKEASKGGALSNVGSSKDFDEVDNRNWSQSFGWLVSVHCSVVGSLLYTAAFTR